MHVCVCVCVCRDEMLREGVEGVDCATMCDLCNPRFDHAAADEGG